MKYQVKMTVTVNDGPEVESVGGEIAYIEQELGWCTWDHLTIDSPYIIAIYTWQEFIDKFTETMNDCYDQDPENELAFESFSGIVEWQCFWLWESSDGDGVYVARYDSTEKMEDSEEADGWGIVEYYDKNKYPISKRMIVEQAEFALDMLGVSKPDTPEMAALKALDV